MARFRDISLLLTLLSCVSLPAAATRAQKNATWESCCGPVDSVCASWASMTFTPPAPVAGDNLTLVGVGTIGGAVVAGARAVGRMDVFVLGADLFQANFNTCGETDISIDGFATANVTALACPTVAGGAAAFSLSMPLPSIGKGVGLVNVTLNATDQTGTVVAFCIMMQATL